MEISYELVRIACFLYGVFMLDRAVQAWERATNQRTVVRSYSDVFIKIIDKVPFKDLFNLFNPNANRNDRNPMPG